MQKHEHHLFLVWLIFSGVIAFLLILAWQENILYQLFTTDRSKISLAIALLYCCVTLHCAMRFFYVSSQINHFGKVRMMIANSSKGVMSISKHTVRVGDSLLPDCLISDYIGDLINKTSVKKNQGETSYTAVSGIGYYEAKLKSPHDMGWFAADIMIKMGLLGTIVGFIFMLASVSNITDFDITTMQKILSHMSAGMSTALYTTMAGLVCSICAAIQYQMLDHNADDLIEAMEYLAQTYVLPELA